MDSTRVAPCTRRLSTSWQSACTEERRVRYLSQAAEPGNQYTKLLDIILTKYRHHSIFISSTSTAVTRQCGLYGELQVRVVIDLHGDVDSACQLKGRCALSVWT